MSCFDSTDVADFQSAAGYHPALQNYTGKFGCLRTSQACLRCLRSCAANRAKRWPKLNFTLGSKVGTLMRARSKPFDFEIRSSSRSWIEMNSATTLSFGCPDAGL